MKLRQGVKVASDAEVQSDNIATERQPKPPDVEKEPLQRPKQGQENRNSDVTSPAISENAASELWEEDQEAWTTR